MVETLADAINCDDLTCLTMTSHDMSYQQSLLSILLYSTVVMYDSVCVINM